MITQIITLIVAYKAKRLKTVIWVAIITPIAFGIIAASTALTTSADQVIVTTVISIPVNVVIGFLGFKHAERKRKQNASI
jgi:accessory gene regulator protein AgrB